MADTLPRTTTFVSRPKAIRTVIWLLAALAVGLFAWRTMLPATNRNTYAFSVYYTSARLALRGEADARICSEWFYEQQRSLGLRADAFCGFGLPPMALVMAPVAWLPPNVARIVWVLLDLGMIAAICALAWRICRSHGWAAPRMTFFIPGSLILIALFQPVHAEINAGQIHVFLALMYTLWLFGYVTKRDWLCGAALSGLMLIKLAGWPLWIFTLLTGRWRALAWAIGLSLIVALVTLPLFTLQFWWIDLQHMLALPSRPANAVPAYQTLLSLLHQTFTYDATWSPRPLLNVPWLATLCLLILATGLMATTLWVERRQPGWLMAMAMLCLVAPLQPAGEQHHYALLLPVLLILITTFTPAHGRPAFIGLAVVVILFALPSYFLDTAAFVGFPNALAAYPRLYGALLAWGWLIYATSSSAKRPSRARHSRDEVDTPAE